jgi:hypothetical protein
LSPLFPLLSPVQNFFGLNEELTFCAFRVFCGPFVSE